MSVSMSTKRVTFRLLWLSVFLLALSIHDPVATAQARSPVTSSGEVDFEAIYYFAQRASHAYGKTVDIEQQDPGTTWISTPGHDDVLYFIEHDPTNHIHTIAVRGTANQTNWSLDEDTRGISDSKAHILVHKGFDDATRAIYADLKKHLKPDYTVYLTGHSLGGAIAGLLAIYLYEDGYKIGAVVTFGQPKFTNQAGVEQYGHLPFVRVVNQNDVVPMLPNSTQSGNAVFVHMGAEVNILSETYYSYLPPEMATQKSLDEVLNDLMLISIPDHKIDWYLADVKAKLREAKRVNYADREKYVVRHKKGPTEPVQYKTNFNSAN